MDRFAIDGRSLLVSNMSIEVHDMETFPVLIGKEVSHFHRIGGGFNRLTNCDIVKFIHDVQGYGRPNHINPDNASSNFEAHLDNYYNMNVEEISTNWDEYPDEDYVVTVRVSDYMSGEYSFSEALTADIDARETQESHQ